MDYISLFGIAVGLSMDAFAVSIKHGALVKKVRLGFALKLGLTFGLFQAIMPMIGSLIGAVGANFIGQIDHWIALLLLGYLGIQMILESRKKQKDGCEDLQIEDISLKTLFTLAIATSIDALATGILLPSAVGASTIFLMLLSVCLIGLTTVILCTVGIYIGEKFGSFLSSKAEIIGGCVLILIGVKIFVEHQFLG